MFFQPHTNRYHLSTWIGVQSNFSRALQKSPLLLSQMGQAVFQPFFVIESLPSPPSYATSLGKVILGLQDQWGSRILVLKILFKSLLSRHSFPRTLEWYGVLEEIRNYFKPWMVKGFVSLTQFNRSSQPRTSGWIQGKGCGLEVKVLCSILSLYSLNGPSLFIAQGPCTCSPPVCNVLPPGLFQMAPSPSPGQPS